MTSGRNWTDLWLFDLSQSVPGENAGHDLLQAQDYQRASGLVSGAQAQAFLASRAALRQVLAGYGADPRAAFVLGPDGKPSLPDGPFFNLSRARHAVLIAVSDAAVGIDLEYRRPLQLHEPQLAAAARVLGQVNGFAGARSDLLQVWTATEAWLKYHGRSMRWFLDDPAALARMASELAAQTLLLRPLDLPLGLCGSVCTATQSRIDIKATETAMLRQCPA